MKKLLRRSTVFTIRMEFPLGMTDATRHQEQEAGAQIDGPDQSGLPSSFLTSSNPSPSPGNKPNFHISNSCLGTLFGVFISLKSQAKQHRLKEIIPNCTISEC